MGVLMSFKAADALLMSIEACHDCTMEIGHASNIDEDR